jgi:DNA-binding LacI/PurR family transcriptional regulator
LNGYLSALEDHRIKFRPELVFDGDYNYESGLRVAKAIDTLSEQPTALLASNDIMAIGCIVGLKELGYRIPEEISVVGVDDIATAQVVDPPLTTVSLPLYDLGATGMESLIKLRRGEIENDGVITLPHHLILRRSAASPAAYTAVE